MRIYTIEAGGEKRPAVEKDGMLYTIEGFADVRALVESGIAGKLRTGKAYSFSDVKVCAPIPSPKQDVICLGVNYEEHRQESVKGIGLMKENGTIYFSKRVNEAPGTGEYIPSYSFVEKMDYEAELGVIIGRKAKNVKREDALSYVFGYTVINDVSARDLQTRHKQFYFAKSLDGYTPMGPCIVTSDEIGNPQKLKITCKVNGELRQNSNTENMILDVAGIIEELSQGMTLLPGTIISTGTPSGVAMGMDNPEYLKAGDEVVCEIEKIGKLINIVGNIE